MNKIFTILILFLIVSFSYSQRQTWQFDFDINQVNVRLDTPFQLVTPTVYIPSDGYVIGKLEGVCTSSKNDRMIFAVSDNKWWSSNFGNIAVTVVDSHLINNFTHGLVFKVKGGPQTFYGLVHNFVDRSGNGIISAKGRLILEFVPDNSTIRQVNFINGVYYPMKLNQSETVRDSISIRMLQSGSAYISLIGSVGSIANQELVFSLRADSPGFPILGEAKILIHDANKAQQFSLNRTLYLAQGDHKVYLTTKKVSGDFESDYNALYSNFNANVFYDNDLDAQIKSIVTKVFLQKYNESTDIAGMDLLIPRKGKLHIEYTGQADISSGEELKMEAKIKGAINNINISTSNVIAHHLDKYGYFCRNEVIDVDSGSIQVYLSAIMNGFDSLLGGRCVEANLTVKFISEAIIGGVKENDFNGSHWVVIPNPINEYFEIKTNEEEIINFSLQVFNSLGDEIYSKNNFNSKNDEINTQNWKQGIYFVYILDNGRKVMKKLVKN